MSDTLVARMWADYQRLGTLQKTAALHGRKLATLWRLFVARGLLIPRSRSGSAARVAAMFADYQAGLSLEQVGRKWNRSRQAVFGTFKLRGLPLREKVFLPVVEYQGLRYTAQKVCGRHKYLRATLPRAQTRYLHHVIWEEHHGPIPPGHKLAFKDGNHLNCTIDNLELLTNSEQVRKYASKGQNQFTATAQARLEMLLAGRGANALDLKGLAA